MDPEGKWESCDEASQERETNLVVSNW